MNTMTNKHCFIYFTKLCYSQLSHLIYSFQWMGCLGSILIMFREIFIAVLYKIPVKKFILPSSHQTKCFSLCNRSKTLFFIIFPPFPWELPLISSITTLYLLSNSSQVVISSDFIFFHHSFATE